MAPMLGAILLHVQVIEDFCGLGASSSKNPQTFCLFACSVHEWMRDSLHAPMKGCSSVPSRKLGEWRLIL